MDPCIPKYKPDLTVLVSLEDVSMYEFVWSTIPECSTDPPHPITRAKVVVKDCIECDASNTTGVADKAYLVTLERKTKTHWRVDAIEQAILRWGSLGYDTILPVPFPNICWNIEPGSFTMLEFLDDLILRYGLTSWDVFLPRPCAPRPETITRFYHSKRLFDIGTEAEAQSAADAFAAELAGNSFATPVTPLIYGGEFPSLEDALENTERAGLNGGLIIWRNKATRQVITVLPEGTPTAGPYYGDRWVAVGSWGRAYLVDINGDVVSTL